MSNYASVFDRHLRELVAEACREWGENPPDDKYYRQIHERLGHSAAEWIGLGFETGLIETDQRQCRLTSTEHNGGRQQWFERAGSNGWPGCSWDYLAQAACFVRLSGPCTEYGLEVKYKSGPIDLTVARGGDILWCVEAGEKIDHLKLHLDDVVRCSRNGEMHASAPRSILQRKADYIIEQQPQFLSCVAIDGQLNFWVKREERGFSLVESDPPLYLPTDPATISTEVAEEVAA